MKGIKLLKKIRKRFSVTYYPKGFWMFDTFFSGKFFIVRDTNNSYRMQGIQITDKPLKNVKYEVLNKEEGRKKSI